MNARAFISEREQIAFLTRRVDQLIERNAYLERLFAKRDDLPSSWRLTPFESRVFNLIYSRGFASVDTICDALYLDREQPVDARDNVRIYICRLRKKIAPDGLVIITNGQNGYEMPERSRARAKELLGR